MKSQYLNQFRQTPNQFQPRYVFPNNRGLNVMNPNYTNNMNFQNPMMSQMNPQQRPNYNPNTMPTMPYNPQNMTFTRYRNQVDQNNRNLNLNLTDDKKRKEEIIKDEVDKLLLARLKQLTRKDKPSKQDKLTSDPDDLPDKKSSDDSADITPKSDINDKKRTLGLFDALGGVAGSLTGGLGDMAKSVGGGVSSMTDAVGGPGVALGAAAAGAGAMKKAQREMEHRYALQKLENEMASVTFQTDFQDKGILDLSKATGRMNYVISRLKSINKCLDFSLENMIDTFYQTVH